MEKFFFEENDSDHILENQINLLKDYFILYIKNYPLDTVTNYFSEFFQKSLLDIFETDLYKVMDKRGILCVCAGSTISLHVWKKKIGLGKNVPFESELKPDVLKDFISEASLEHIVEKLLKIYSGDEQVVTKKLSLFLQKNEASVLGNPVLCKMAEHVGSQLFRRVISLNGCHFVSEYVALIKRNAMERKNNEYTGSGNGTYSFKVKSKNGDKVYYTFNKRGD